MEYGAAVVFLGLLAASASWAVWRLVRDGKIEAVAQPSNSAANTTPVTSAVDVMAEIDRIFGEMMDRKAAHCHGDWFYARVAGVSFKNDDRTSRQKIIRGLECGDFLLLEWDPENKFGAAAFNVLTMERKQIGFLPHRVAVEALRDLKKGMCHLGIVKSTGDSAEGTALGVIIAVLRWDSAYEPPDE